ncbi:MAG: T9SS type A sorting domain-containing protein [Bacteroidales bacterium]|nr:T9SS type A sorting domain-containing protein [Bacteroidales bacterium]
MKKFLLSIMSFVLMSTLCFGQEYLENFEGAEPGFGLGVWDDATVAIVDNPSKTGINTSNKCLKITTGSQVYSGAGWVLPGFIVYNGTDSTVTLKVYSTNSGKLIYGFENAADYTNNGYAAGFDYTAGTWTEVTFKIADGEDNNQNKVIIKPDEGVGDKGEEWFIDDLSWEMTLFSEPSDVEVELALSPTNASAMSIKYALKGAALGDAINLTLTDGKFTATLEDVAAGPYYVQVTADGNIVDTLNLDVFGSGDAVSLKATIFQLPAEDGTANAYLFEEGITVDGIADESVWENQPGHYPQNILSGNPTDLGYFKLAWNEDNLYVLTVIEDEEIQVNTTDTWNADNIELFLDMDKHFTTTETHNSTTITGIGIWQLRMLPTTELVNTFYGQGYVSATEIFGGNFDFATNFATAQRAIVVEEGVKYTVEWKLPWSILSNTFFAELGESFGMDMNIADDQDATNSAGRNSSVSWNSTADINYQRSEMYGTVTLAGVAGTNDKNINKVAVYPTIADNMIKIGAEVKSVTIYNVAGVKVLSVYNNNNVDVSTLQSGLYYGETETGATFKFIKK